MHPEFSPRARRHWPHRPDLFAGRRTRRRPDGREIGLADAALEALADRLEQQIAGGMPERVVDVLEPVEIEVKNCEGRRAAPGRCEGLAQPFDEGRAIGESSNRVGRSQDADLVGDFFPFRYIRQKPFDFAAAARLRRGSAYSGIRARCRRHRSPACEIGPRRTSPRHRRLRQQFHHPALSSGWMMVW